jgi:predicted CopG family antitoxin
MHRSCMATTSTTITINAEAYKLLKRLKDPGHSFSDVILEYVRPPARTCGELLERLEFIEAPIIDREVMKEMRTGRGRRSSRKARGAR